MTVLDLSGAEAHEYEQQQLVEKIVSVLHSHTDDVEDCRNKFRLIAVCILCKLGNKLLPNQSGDYAFKVCVMELIEAFTSIPEEQEYLLVMVFEKVSAPATSGFVETYQLKQMGLTSQEIWD